MHLFDGKNWISFFFNSLFSGIAPQRSKEQSNLRNSNQLKFIAFWANLGVLGTLTLFGGVNVLRVAWNFQNAHNKSKNIFCLSSQCFSPSLYIAKNCTIEKFQLEKDKFDSGRDVCIFLPELAVFVGGTSHMWWEWRKPRRSPRQHHLDNAATVLVGAMWHNGGKPPQKRRFDVYQTESKAIQLACRPSDLVSVPSSCGTRIYTQCGGPQETRNNPELSAVAYRSVLKS